MSRQLRSAERRFERIVAGREVDRAPSGAICELALRLRDHAKRTGLAPAAFIASRVRYSASRILVLIDGDGREWRVRVSNHFLPRRTGHLEPHLDFVSFDAAAGADRARAWLDRVARGEVEWCAPQLRPRRKGVRR